MSISRPASLCRTGQTHRSAVGIYAHQCGALGDLLGISEIAQVAFLTLCSASQEDVLGLEAQQFVPRDALPLAQVNEPHSDTSHACYHETQSHIEAFRSVTS